MTELARLLSPDRVLTDEASLNEYGRDWVKYLEPKPTAIVFPKTTEEVAALVRWARPAKMALVPSGGRTGLSGGAAALNGEVVVSFQKMNQILEFDPLDQTVEVEAGVITETIQKFAEERGLSYPVDFAARGSSQIGGNVATNAGGIKVLRYGLTRDWVVGLEVVTGTGEVLRLNNGLVKNATGYDLRHLMIGSEGTLGLVTKVTLKLARAPAPTSVFTFGVADLNAVMKIYHAFKTSLAVTAFEMYTDVALKAVIDHNPAMRRPLSEAHPYYVLVECETPGDEGLERALGLFERGLEDGWIQDGCQAQSPAQARDLWALREHISESLAPHFPYKNDVAVRVARVPEFLSEVDRILSANYPHFTVVWFGHVGDGNLHINILRPSGLDAPAFLSECKKVDQLLFEMIERFGGSISAEHGVGLMKRPYLHHTRSAAEVELMRGIKDVFDPDGILNPGKLL